MDADGRRKWRVVRSEKFEDFQQDTFVPHIVLVYYNDEGEMRRAVLGKDRTQAFERWGAEEKMAEMMEKMGGQRRPLVMYDIANSRILAYARNEFMKFINRTAASYDVSETLTR